MLSNQFRVLDLQDNDDYELWLKSWSESESLDVFCHPDYLRLFLNEHSSGHLAIFTCEDFLIAFPFIKKSIPDDLLMADENYFDIASPYGYGGPSYLRGGQAGRNENAEIDFWASIKSWANSRGVISEFVRFHLNSPFLPAYPGTLKLRGVNIVRDLDTDWESVWSDFAKKVRKDVRKAQNLGVHITVDLSGTYLDDFLEIYESTMNRREAADHYYFGRPFFESLQRRLGGSFAYFHAWANDQIISSEMVLLSKDACYSFLGGTRSEAFEFHPNHLLKTEVMKWCQQHGRRTYVLGGGASPGDGIEGYKKSFSPNSSYPVFTTGQRIFDDHVYSKLTKRRRELRDLLGHPQEVISEYFPEYMAI